MRQLFLLRHAKSSWANMGMDDIDRPLNERGRAAAQIMGEVIEDLALAPDLVVCSPSKRTRETLARLSDGCPELKLAEVRFDDRIYEASLPDLLTVLGSIETQWERVMLIGHYPGIARLALALSDGEGDRAAEQKIIEKYSTCALTTLLGDAPDWSQAGPGRWRLTAYIRPKDVAEIAQ